MRVLFRVAAGPRLGFGHLVRCRSLARALGVPPIVSIRGSLETRRAAAARGFEVWLGGISLLRGGARPDVLVVDDPSAQQATLWVRRAREYGVPVATLHDLGLGYVDSELPIDGSIEPGRHGEVGLAGPMYAVLDPSIAIARDRHETGREGVLIALGGGGHVHRWGLQLASAILELRPDTRVRIVEGFSHTAAGSSDPRIEWVSAPQGLSEQLASAAVAVVAGGLTLYEAAALGTPAVALAVVTAQQPTIRGFARRGAVLDAGLVTDPLAARHAAVAVADLLTHPARAHKLGGTAAHLVDGRGVFRAADAIRQLAGRSEDHSHAA